MAYIKGGNLFSQVKKSVTKTIAKAMVGIFLLSIATTGFAIITLASSLNDAEAVNVAGSMRMQSYRLAHDIQTESGDYLEHIKQFEASIYSPSMKALQNWDVPDDITQDYYQLIMRWHELKTVLRSEEREHYLHLVAAFVNQIDAFVFKLQHFSENKLITLAWVGGLGLGGVLLISLFVVHFVRTEVVRPLRSLVLAGERMQSRVFDIELNIQSDNELGTLSKTFNNMAKELGKLYRGLENAVNEKTHRLQHANQSLQVLYQSSQELTDSRITPEHFQAILKHFVSIEGIVAAKLEINQADEPSLVLVEGKACVSCGSECRKKPLEIDGQHLGYLYLKNGLPCPDETLIDNFVQIFSRAVYYNHVQRQTEHILLMEERATIARELHDSLAQSLAYLKIQVSLLKRCTKSLEGQREHDKTRNVMAELDEGLNGAYTQLRELLTTFRLTIKEGSFGQALNGMMQQLNEQTTANIEVSNQLSSVELDAHQQVHLMQLIREATLNAIKHAKADHINIECLEQQHQIQVTISDDGIGFDRHSEKVNHYGMSIMYERAERLNGDLLIDSQLGKGCRVELTFRRTGG